MSPLTACLRRNRNGADWRPRITSNSILRLRRHRRPIEESTQPSRARRVTKFRKRLRFDLAYALACDVEVLPNLFKPPLLAGLIETKTHLDDLFLPRSQRREHVFSQLAQVVGYCSLRRISGTPVLDEARDRSLAIISDRRFKRDWLLSDLQCFAHFPRRHVHSAGKLLVSRFAAEFLNHQSLCAEDLVDDLDHMHRDANRAALIGDRAGHRLANLPRRIS